MRPIGPYARALLTVSCCNGGTRLFDDAKAPGLRDELITDELAGLLEAVVDRTESRPLDPSEALERLGKHLLGVARRLRAPSDDEKLAETTAVVNAAIEALGGDLQGDRVAPPARILQGVRHESGLARMHYRVTR